MKKLLIFDLDGTLLDTVADLAAACNRVLDEAGFPVYPEMQYRKFVGNGIAKLIERAIPAEARTPELIERLKHRFLEYYTARIDTHTRPYPGIPELLVRLREEGVKLAVASNKFQQGTESLVSKFFPDIPFVAVFGQRTGIPAKPHPAIVAEIIAIAGVGPNDTLYIGDSDVDMLTARNAGVESVGAAWGFRGEKELLESGAGIVAREPSDIFAAGQRPVATATAK